MSPPAKGTRRTILRGLPPVSTVPIVSNCRGVQAGFRFVPCRLRGRNMFAVKHFPYKAATVGRAPYKAATVGRAQRRGKSGLNSHPGATTGRGFIGRGFMLSG